MMILTGLILIAAGIAGIVYFRPKFKNDIMEIQYMETSTIDELETMFAQMDESGLGSDYRQYVELKGPAFVNQPVTTPFSNQSVAYCESRLQQVTEEKERYRDSKGNYHDRINKREHTISNEKSGEAIYLRDSASGTQILLDLSASGCKLDIPTTYDRFEPKNNLHNHRFFHSFSYNSNDASTLGFRMNEKTIKVNQMLYVIGEAFKTGDQIMIGRPMDSKKPFIISTKSEDDLVNHGKRNAQIALLGGIAAIVAGIVCIVMYF